MAQRLDAQTMEKGLNGCPGEYLSYCNDGFGLLSDIIRRQVSSQAKDVWFVDGRFASDNAIGVAFIAGKAAKNG